MRSVFLVPFALVLPMGVAHAEEPRIHVAAGATHAASDPQRSEFGPGGGGSAFVELPLSTAVGVQAGLGAVLLSEGETPRDPGLAPAGTGTALLGLGGVRLRPFAAWLPAGLWIDANAGVAQTGTRTRPAFGADIGWEVRLARTSRWSAGPFLGYTQVVEPSDSLRPDDARILWAGLTVSFGEKPAPVAAPPPQEPPREAPRPPPIDQDGNVEAYDGCPEPEMIVGTGGACEGGIRVVDDRILLDDVIHFEFDRAKIAPRSFRLMRRIAEFLRVSHDIVEVSIEGHADAVGTEDYNQRLSEARAEQTRAFLIQLGVEPSRLKLVGYGKSRLRVQNMRPDERNRRVELFVLRRTSQAATHVRLGDRGQP